MDHQNNSETMGLEEAAKFLRLGLNAMKELAESGAVPATRLNQKHWVFLRADLVAYLHEEGRRQAEARKIEKLRSAARAAKPKKPARRALPDLDNFVIAK